MGLFIISLPNLCYFIVPDDMVENENETLRDRVADLEKKVHDQNDEITCLRATLADALRRINQLESGKGSFTTFFAQSVHIKEHS